MSRTSEKRARRAEARRQEQAPGSLRQNRNLWVAGLVGVVLLLVVLIFVVNAGGPQPTPAASTPPSGTPAALATEVVVPQIPGTHVNPGEPHAKYNSNPPTSGPHYPAPATWGRYDTALPEETWIHNLEHGGIVALYNCAQPCPDLVSKFDALYKSGPLSKYNFLKMILTAYPKMTYRVALVAWGYYLPLEDYDDASVRAFIKKYQDHGPEDTP